MSRGGGGRGWNNRRDVEFKGEEKEKVEDEDKGWRMRRTRMMRTRR